MRTGFTADGGMVLGMIFGIAFGNLVLGMIVGLLFGAAVASRRRGSSAPKSN